MDFLIKMKGTEYLLGVAESLGFILISVVPSISPVPVLIVLAILSCINEKP